MTDTRHFKDAMGLWPKHGNPPNVPFPAVCPRTLLIPGIDAVRYMEWVNERWEVPPDPPPPPERGADFTAEERTWAALHPSDPISAWVLDGVQNCERKYAALSDRVKLSKKKWIFPIGERFSIEGATCREVKFMGTGTYGDRYLCVFETEEHEIAWWTGSNAFCDPGWTGTLKATVRAHTIFGGAKVTTVDRCADAAVKRTRRTTDGATE